MGDFKKYNKAVFDDEEPISGNSENQKSKKQAALDRAWYARSFEIEMYWKRSLYFWGFIALISTGYFAAFSDNHYVFSFLIGIMGLLFSTAWFFVNFGSKFWQENWENHIDFLEDELEGKLYKTLLKKNFQINYSVSKVNLFCSAFVAVMWIGLIVSSLYKVYFPKFSFKDKIIETWPTFESAFCVVSILLFLLVLLLHLYGKAKTQNYKFESLDSWSLEKLENDLLSPKEYKHEIYQRSSFKAEEEN